MSGPPAHRWRVVSLAADYRIEIAPVLDPRGLVTAARSLLEARELPRTRPKGGDVVTYDLRRLLVNLTVDAERGTPIRVRTRIHPEFGSGRPEEVLAALGERVGSPLDVRSVVRERLVLSDDTG